jgi:hypothetical protein
MIEEEGRVVNKGHKVNDEGVGGGGKGGKVSKGQTVKEERGGRSGTDVGIQVRVGKGKLKG